MNETTTPAAAPVINNAAPAAPVALAPAIGGWKKVLMQVGALTVAAGAGAAGGYLLAKRQEKSGHQAPTV